MKRSDDDPNTDDKLSALRKTFNRLDSDGDGYVKLTGLKSLYHDLDILFIGQIFSPLRLQNHFNSNSFTLTTQSIVVLFKSLAK